MGYDVWQTCFLLPIGLTRSECASWVQAWGSIGAIVAAAGIAMWNDRRLLRLRRLLAVRKTRTLAASLSAAAETIMALAGTKDSNKEMRSMLVSIEEMLIDARSIEQELLDLPWTGAVMSLRSVGAQMAEQLRLVKSIEAPGAEAEALAQRFRKYNELIDAQIQVVREQHRGAPITYD